MPKEKDNWEGKCHACSKKKTPEQLTKQNGMVCQECYDKHIVAYKKNKEIGKHNSPVIFCQDCKSQFKLFKTTATNPFEDWDDNVSAAERLHEGIPYQITPLCLTRWKCNCKRQPIITIGMNCHNWAEGYIEQRAKETKEWDDMTEAERDELESEAEKKIKLSKKPTKNN